MMRARRSILSPEFVFKITQFLASGLPGFLVALASNYALVEKLGWPKPPTYLLVLWLQMTVNFFACRLFVFNIGIRAPFYRQYVQFLSGVGLIRMVEWVVYTAAVEGLHFYYLAVQMGNIVLFAIVKFKFAESLFERASPVSADRDDAL